MKKKTEEELELFRRKHPGFPEHAIPKTRPKRSPANELAHLINVHVQLLGGACYRINSQGQYDPKLKKWRQSGMVKGLADLTVIYLGRHIAVEIKIGKDKMSEHQKSREAEIKASGGYYMIAKDIDQFKADFKTIVDQIKAK